MITTCSNAYQVSSKKTPNIPLTLRCRLRNLVPMSPINIECELIEAKHGMPYSLHHYPDKKAVVYIMLT